MKTRIGAVVTIAVGALALWAVKAPAQHEHGMSGQTMTGHQMTGHASGAHEMTGGSDAGHSHEKSEMHGGAVTMTDGHHVETVFGPDGVRVYLYSMDQEPLAADKLAGTVLLKDRTEKPREVRLTPFTPKDGEPALWYCTMHDSPPQMKSGACPVCGMKLVAQTGLFAPVDLSKAQRGSVEATVHVTGLSGDEKDVTVTEKNVAVRT